MADPRSDKTPLGGLPLRFCILHLCPIPLSRGMNSGAFDFLSLPLIFHLTRIIAVIQYPCCILRPGSSRGVSVLGPCL